MKQTNKTKRTKLKTTLLITIIAINTGCATNNPHKKVALKIIKNNNVILKEIKKEQIWMKIDQIDQIDQNG